MVAVNVSKKGYSVIVLASSLISYYVVSNKASFLFELALFLYVLVTFLYVYVEAERNIVLGSLGIRRFFNVLEDETPSNIFLEIDNRSIYPLFLSIEDSIPKRFRALGEAKRYVMLGGKTKIILSYKVVPSPGHSIFGPVKVVVEDPLHLFSSEVDKNVEVSEVFVIPRPKYILELKRSQERELGFVSERKSGGRGTSFLYIRKYVEGDELRHIDWKATARTGKLLVKVFESESQKSSTIVFINDKTLSYGTYAKAFDSALRLLASLIKLSQGSSLYKIKLIVLTDNKIKVYQSSSASESSKVLLKALASLDISKSVVNIEIFRKLMLFREKGSEINLVLSNHKLLNVLKDMGPGIKVYYIDPELHELKGDPKELIEKVKKLKKSFERNRNELYIVTPIKLI